MANQAYRDVNTVNLLGIAIQGVQSVRMSDRSEQINYNADANAYRQDVGITKQSVGITVERVSSSKYRDVLSAVFTSQQGSTTGAAILGRVQSVDIEQGGTVLRDSGDADAWIRYIGVTDINGTVRVSARDISQHRSGVLVKGKKGTLTVKLPVPRTGFGLPAGTATETHKVACVITDLDVEGEHGGLGSGSVGLAMYGATNPWTPTLTTGPSMRPIEVGDVGTVSYVVPAADAGSAESVSVLGGTCTRISVAVRHGELARATYEFEHKSADGATTPVS